MSRSVTPALRRIILVTGFGAFPGAPRNPTETLVRRLERHRGRLARLGVDLRCVVLPVRYADLPDRLATLATRHRPDVILHFGVAGRRKRVSVETRAVNHASPLHPDASGRRPAQTLRPAQRQVLHASYPSRRIFAALRGAGIAAEISRDAGDYVCNAALFHSLAQNLAPEIGFIHVPKPRRRSVRSGVGPKRLAAADLDRAALCAVLSLAKRRTKPCTRPGTKTRSYAAATSSGAPTSSSSSP